ncbi:MAG: glutamate--tRNA ligase [Parcubacteria group bacterium]|nr:glutamate--tRNA ligase [Parcubacteria group bacterium]
MATGIRTRFAPSPTGPLHMGNARTALFNYLFSRKEGGVFLLRIEDTDKERSEKRWEEDLLENLTWLGLAWDEGPFRQSERVDIYKEALQTLFQKGKAYYCFCTEDELEALRQDQISRGETPKYSGKCRALKAEEAEQRQKNGEPSVIRFALEPRKVKFHDLIRGNIEFDTGLMGDIVVAKDWETPLYNFSATVDDAAMDITHVIRGEDHISNTPKQILLQEALGLKRPLYAHLPLILGEDRTKLSKRHGDFSIAHFRKQGYLAEAIINFLALLGWNPGTEKEIFSLSSLIKEFSLERVQKGGAMLQLRKLEWINAFFIRQMSLQKLSELSIPYLKEAGLVADASLKTVEPMVRLYQERIKKLFEVPELLDFFFKKPEYSADLLVWKDVSKKDISKALQELATVLQSIEEKDWNKEIIETIVMPHAERQGSRGVWLWPMRVALTGKEASAGPFEVATVLGKKETLERVASARKKLR